MFNDPAVLQNMLSGLDPDPAPSDPAAEEALVSFLLANPEQAGALLGQLGADDFQGERSRCTWMLAGKLQGMGIPLSPQAMYDLAGMIGLEKHFERLTGGREYLECLAADAPEAAFIPHAVRMVKGAAHRRKIIGLMGELKDLAGNWHGDNTVLDEKVAAVLAYIRGGMKKRNPAGRLSFTAREMAEGAGRGPIWLVPNLLLQGGLNLLAGEVSSGKTFLALDLAIAVASGGVPWRVPSAVGAIHESPLQDCNTGQGERTESRSPSPVLYFCLDTSRQTLQRRLAELCQGRDIDPPENLHFDLSPLDLSQPQAFTALKNMVLERGAGLVILDALARYLPNVDENNVSSISPVLTGLRAITAETGITILILHHLNKGAGYAQKTPSALRIRGSSDILAAVDTAMVCTGPASRSGGKILSFTRDDKTTGNRADAYPTRRLIPVKNREQPESPPTTFRILPGDAGGVCIYFDAGDPGLHSYSPVLPTPTLAEAFLAHLAGHPGQVFGRSQLRQQLQDGGIDASRRAVMAAFTAIAACPEIRVTRKANTYSYTWVGKVNPCGTHTESMQGKEAPQDLGEG